jgi:hypothetical protein
MTATEASVLSFPRRVPRCEHCGWLVPPGTATEAAHHERCVLPRQRVARLAAYHRQQLQEAQAKAAAEAERLTRRRAPLPPSRPSAWHRERLELLQAALSYPEMHGRLTETTRLPLSALERVATGRSTMGATAWRRLLVELDR